MQSKDVSRYTERVSCRVQACLREGMRVFPPVPTLTREAERDMDLAGYKVPKGTMLGVAVFSMHNNPAYWQVHAREDTLIRPLHRCHTPGAAGKQCGPCHMGNVLKLVRLGLVPFVVCQWALWLRERTDWLTPWKVQEPERYLPERFIEGTPECAAKPAHGYLPFGDGLRQCIGLRFAIMEVCKANTNHI